MFVLGAVAIAAGCGSDDDQQMGPSNHAPMFLGLEPDTVDVGATLERWCLADDLDGDSLTYGCTVLGSISDLKLRGLPDVDFDPAEGHFVFRVKSNDRPDREFLFTADDGRGGRDSTHYTVTVR